MTTNYLINDAKEKKYYSDCKYKTLFALKKKY